ncbi:MAG TPA: VCBS repeat-containing protein [Planctomycetota bacterium]|jgi:hypothetical protein
MVASKLQIFWRILVAALLIGALIAALHSHVSALVERQYTLKEVLDASKVVIEGEIESIDAGEKFVVAKVTATLKGKCAFKQIKMNIGMGQVWHPDAFMKHVKVGAPVIFFYDIDNGKLPCLAYISHFWFQIYADVGDDPDKQWWWLTHIELLMNRTYNGTTPELMSLVRDVLSGKREPPAADPKLAPLTRDSLLGQDVAAAPKPGAPKMYDQPDRGEDNDGWSVTEWGQPARADICELQPSHGNVLRIRYGGPPNDAFVPEAAKGAGKHDDKVSVVRRMEADFSAADRLLFEARNDSKSSVSIALAFSTMDWQYLEAPKVDLPPGRWNYDLCVDLTAHNFKSAESKWLPNSELCNRKRVTKIFVVVYNPPQAGTLYIDRIRMDNQSVFVRSIPLSRPPGPPGGVAWVDFDGDGKLDAFVCAPTPADPAALDGFGALLAGGNRLYQNHNNDFFDVTLSAGITGRSSAAFWADFNGDGHSDLLYSHPAALWTNDHGKFRNDSALLTGLAPDAKLAGWLDANGDGFPDVLLATPDKGLTLLLNKGKEATFLRACQEWQFPESKTFPTAFMTLADYDGDGFTDIFLSHKPLLLRNEDGKGFRAVPRAPPFPASETCGIAWGDYDNDGALDAFVPLPGQSCLWHNNNDGTFTNVIEQSGALARLPPGACSAAWGDVNGDEWLDLVVGFETGPALLFLSDRGKFAAPISLEPFPCASGARGMAFGDFDDDGDLDLLISGKDTAGILVNAFPRSRVHTVGFKVRLPARCATGALVRLYDERDRPLGIRQIGLGSSWGSQEPPEAFFAVEAGTYKVNVLLSNGQSRQETVLVTPKQRVWEMRDGK